VSNAQNKFKKAIAKKNWGKTLEQLKKEKESPKAKEDIT
jgi:hypothetical protein